MLAYADEPVPVQVRVDRADRNLVEPARVHRVVPSAHSAAAAARGLLVGLLGWLVRLLRGLIGLLRGLIGLLRRLIIRLRLLVTLLRRLLIRWHRRGGGSSRAGGLCIKCMKNTDRTNDGIADLGITLLDDHHICDIESTTLNTTNQTYLSRTLRLAKMRTTVFLRISPL